MLRVDGSEVPLTGAEHLGHDVHGDLVHQPEGQGLSARVAGRDRNIAAAGEFLRDRDRGSYVVDEPAGCLRMPAVRPRPVRHDN